MTSIISGNNIGKRVKVTAIVTTDKGALYPKDIKKVENVVNDKVLVSTLSGVQHWIDKTLVNLI